MDSVIGDPELDVDIVVAQDEDGNPLDGGEAVRWARGQMGNLHDHCYALYLGNDDGQAFALSNGPASYETIIQTLKNNKLPWDITDDEIELVFSPDGDSTVENFVKIVEGAASTVYLCLAYPQMSNQKYFRTTPYALGNFLHTIQDEDMESAIGYAEHNADLFVECEGGEPAIVIQTDAPDVAQAFQDLADVAD